MSHFIPRSVAIIGSFRQHYQPVLEAWSTFSQAGLEITSPKGAPVIEPGIDFVRFESDSKELTDDQVESLALNRILRADFAYAVLPEGYAGRTTCYEIGRILQTSGRLYFSERPADLPIEVPPTHIATAAELIRRFDTEHPQSLISSLGGTSLSLETKLTTGDYSYL